MGCHSVINSRIRININLDSGGGTATTAENRHYRQNFYFILPILAELDISKKWQKKIWIFFEILEVSNAKTKVSNDSELSNSARNGKKKVAADGGLRR